MEVLMKTEHYRATIVSTVPSLMETTEVYAWRAPGSKIVMERYKIIYLDGNCFWSPVRVFKHLCPKDMSLATWLDQNFYCEKIEELSI